VTSQELTSEELLTEINSAFEPFRPPSKEVYVEFEEIRGKWDVVRELGRELGREITRSKEPTCQLYSGLTGVGKSTELLRFQEYFERNRYFVVYFAADNQDLVTLAVLAPINSLTNLILLRFQQLK
jgi:signal recognition particle GTPase